MAGAAHAVWVDRLGRLIGAGPGQVVVGESTSVQLYKLVVAALGPRPTCGAVAVADDEFPTDRYVVEGVAAAQGLQACDGRHRRARRAHHPCDRRRHLP